MKTKWEDQDISKALKDLAKVGQNGPWVDHVWNKIEDHIVESKRSFLDHKIWRPWGHPVRWVVAASFLFIAFSGVFYHMNQQDSMDKADMVSYLINVSEPTANIGKETNFIKVSPLISEASPTDRDVQLIADDDHSDTFSADDAILL